MNCGRDGWHCSPWCVHKVCLYLESVSLISYEERSVVTDEVSIFFAFHVNCAQRSKYMNAGHL